VRIAVFASLALFVFPLARADKSDTSAHALPVVAILANAADPGSMELARHYAAARGLSDSSIIALPLSTEERITWAEFVATLWNPLVRESIARGWLVASASDALDPAGRLRVVSAGHRLDALVICRGVPLGVLHDPALFDASTNPLAAQPKLQTNGASVDSELVLLAADNPPIAALVPNPVFGRDQLSSILLEQVLPVGRLDGPSLADAKGLVDRAIEAERLGLAGRAYVDIGGPHAQGDEWLAECAAELIALGFETDIDRARPAMPTHARFDAPVLYFGWYQSNLSGPFSAPGFRFPVGAVALHIHSFSASTLRSTSRGWSGPLVARGVTATVGNVAEPYLEFTHQPHLLLRALARGETLGRAALYSIRALSWQNIVIGDPLYRPFAVSLDEQWRRATLAATPDRMEPYIRIRRMRQLDAAGRGDEALALGITGLRKNPSLALALTLAGLQLAAGDSPAALRSLGVFSLLPDFRPADQALIMAAARASQTAGDAAGGVRLVERLLALDKLPKDVRLEALRQGGEIARAALDFPRAAAWESEYARLSAPPPKP
jgi:uncharacterized protein (TIGR03790 family)